MTSHPDKLFRDKLENYSRPVPVAAWERVQSNIHKKNYKGLWLKIAAGLVLLAVAAILLWPASSEAPATLSQQNTAVKEAQTPLLATEQSVSTTEEADKASYTAPKEIQKKSVTEKITPVEKKQEDLKLLAVSITPEEPIAMQENEVVTEIETTPLVTTAVAENTESAPSHTTIIYTADEVNARFMKKELVADATPDDKKSSGIQKLVDIAYSLKNSENGLGDLRQKKDEILALNFRDKKQTQN